jgi:tRNA 2-thiouridine synthesizing protein E
MVPDNALLTVRGTSYQLNEEGRLQDNGVWTEEIALALAANDGVTLAEDHWKIITLLRAFYKEFNHAPIMKLFVKEVRQQLGEELASQACLRELFPENILVQSTRFAGIPSPHKASLITETKTALTSSEYGQKKKPTNEYDAFEFDGEIFHLTKEGNLVEQYHWSERMAEHLAHRERIKLTDDHWLVIRFMRAFYDEYMISPMVKLLIKHMQESIGAEKSNKKYLYELFPAGPSKQGARIAGLPDPVGCID